MNDSENKKREIKSALAAIAGSDFLQPSKDLLAVLDYRSELTEKLWETVDEFIEELPARNKNTKTEQEFRNSVESVELVFQVTSHEINASGQLELLDLPSFDKKNEDSFMFFTVELKDKDYPRGKYAQFTREVNKRFMMPIVVFFRVKDRLTIGFVGRRPNQLDESKDVLEKVTLIKDIRLDNPHRAHLEVLFELSLAECAKWMAANNKQQNFDGLLAAWLARLDTEELNKKFYRELFDWFEWAVAEGKFPTDENRTLKSQEHVIHLITRLLFVWFIKEKGLVAEELFNETQVRDLLEYYDRDTGDSYYRAVLQNLFFATLNTEIEKRGFSPRTNAKHRDFSLYRYREQISTPDKLLALFAQTPFINGGLFDCLDSEEATRDGGYRIDCFSDEHYKKLSIPNRLFFDDARGLIPLLKHYKFTVEENTPIEQEVALDPELLGKVFENLLAAYNPETGATARKQTGSYYTPRAIVDYMVEEALVATLTGQVSPTDGDTKFWDERLRYLFDYAKAFDDASAWFDSRESDEIVRAISELKILDPAVGSGAFPMGTLHKLTLALRRLDPDNTRWEQLQKERAIQRAADAFDTKDRQTRDEELKEISRIFENYSGNFGRKLYLIQNSIFGVDIQSVACQIAKLRFFISLAIEQEPDPIHNNLGFKPLPNLETRFIAANTLIGLKDIQLLVSEELTRDLEQELRDNRERYFHATSRPQKLACKKKDKQLRQELAAKLKSAGMPTEDAGKIAYWDPYDQNAKTNWFDPEWMFSVKDNFDVIIGNPPYIGERRNEKIFHEVARTEFGKKFYTRWMDYFYFFFHRSLDMGKRKSIIAFITTNYFITATGANKLRQDLYERTTIKSIINFNELRIFESSQGQHNAITIAIKDKVRTSKARNCLTSRAGIATSEILENIVSWRDLETQYYEVSQEQLYEGLDRQIRVGGYGSSSGDPVQVILDKLKKQPDSLGDLCHVLMGLVSRADKVSNSHLKKYPDLKAEKGDGIFVLTPKELKSLNLNAEDYAKYVRPFYKNSDIGRYFSKVKNTFWLLYIKDEGKPIKLSQELKTHFGKFETLLRKGKENFLKNKIAAGFVRKWLEHGNYFVLFNPKEEEYFTQPKIIAPYRSRDNVFAYNEIPWFASQDVCFILAKNPEFDLKYVLALLNSKLYYLWLYYKGKRKGEALELCKKPISDIPIKRISRPQQMIFINFVNQILDAKRTNPDADVSELENKIDQIVYSLYDLTPEEIAIVEAA